MTVEESNLAGSRPRPGLVFAVVASAVGMSNLDLFVVNVALPAIGRHYHGSSLSTLSWVLNGYAIAFAALLVPFGRMADRLGRRSGFLLGTAVFTLASAGCAASPAVGWLIAARVVQAAGAAMLVPTSLALLMAATPAQRRPPIVRAWTAVGGAAAAIGPVVGGLLTQLDWRWVFLINVPVGLVCLILGARVLPRLDASAEGRLPDPVSTLLLTFSVGLIALALVKAQDWGWGSGRFVFTAAGAVLAGALLVWRCARHPAPVLEISLLRIRGFAGPTVAVTLFTVGFAVMLLSVVLWCQQVWGYSALLTGLAVAPGPVMVPLLTFAVGPLTKRLGGPDRVAVLGIAAFAAGLGWWAGMVGAATRDYWTQILPGMLLTGIGVGLALPALIATAATVLPGNRFATGTGVIQMARQIGSVVGVAALVTILGGHAALTTAALGHFRQGWLTAVGVCVLAALASLPARRQRRARSEKPGRELPADNDPESLTSAR